MNLRLCLCLPAVLVVVFRCILNKRNDDMVEFWGWYTAPDIHYMLVVHQVPSEQ